MFKWLRRNSKDKAMREEFHAVLDKKNKTMEEIKTKLDQFRIPVERRTGTAVYHGPERRVHA